LNFSIDSPANSKTIWTRPSLPEFSPPAMHPMSISRTTGTTTTSSMNVPPIPSTGSTQTALSRKTNPQSEVTRISSTSAVHKHKYIGFQLNSHSGTHLASHPRGPSTRKREIKKTRRKATNACYQSANTTTPTLPQQTATKPGLAIQHGQGRWDNGGRSGSGE
jgi:hypothetical protein